MKKAIFHLKRDIYQKETTLGELIHPDGSHFCWVLEDVVRGYGIKDKKNTAIPCTEGDFTYTLRVRQSPKYGSVCTLFTNESNGIPILENGGIAFKYIRMHGGNDAGDTEGCPLVNKERSTNTMKAWGSMKEALAESVSELELDGFDVRLRITNLPQKI